MAFVVAGRHHQTNTGGITQFPNRPSGQLTAKQHPRPYGHVAAMIHPRGLSTGCCARRGRSACCGRMSRCPRHCNARPGRSGCGAALGGRCSDLVWEASTTTAADRRGAGHRARGKPTSATLTRPEQAERARANPALEQRKSDVPVLAGRGSSATCQEENATRKGQADDAPAAVLGGRPGTSAADPNDLRLRRPHEITSRPLSLGRGWRRRKLLISRQSRSAGLGLPRQADTRPCSRSWSTLG